MWSESEATTWLAITIITPITTTLCHYVFIILSSIFSTQLMSFVTTSFLQTPPPLPTPRALSTRNHHCHIQPFSLHWILHTLTAQTSIQHHITIYSYPPIFINMPSGYSHWSWCHYLLQRTHPPTRLEFGMSYPWSLLQPPTLLKWLEHHQANRSASWWASHIIHSFSVCCPHPIWASQTHHPFHPIQVFHSVLAGMEGPICKVSLIEVKIDEDKY